MADFQQSLFAKGKVSHGNAYDDGFGGPPKYSVPTLASRVVDYSEIFGNFFASRTSSIPILDFPLLNEDQVALDVPSNKFDYTEIFGGFNAGDFAVPYEELFSERHGTQNPSSNSWSPGEGATQQAPEVVSTAPLEINDQDLFVSSSVNQSSSSGISEHIYDGTEQFKVSYNKSNQGSKGDPLSGTTHIAHLHDVPGFTVLINSRPPPNRNKCDNSVVLKNYLSLKGDSNGEIMVETQFREISSHILGSNVVEKTSENEIITDEKYLCSKQISKKDVLESGKSDIHCFSNQMPLVQKANLKQIHLQSTAPEGASAEDLHNSCDPIADLPSDGDELSEKVVFRTISDINLRTQPSLLPPPSKPPPKLGNSKKLKAYQNELYCGKPMRITETYHFGSAFHTCTRQEYDASPPSFDVEVDASAAAAMSEAMEKAQVKLKSAKESMERKKDGHQGRMELNLNGEKNFKEQRLSRCTHESHTFKDEEAQDSCNRQNPQINDFARVDKCKMMSTADMASDYERKMGDTELTTASMEKNCRGSLDEEKAGEWKVEKQYFELLNNEKAFRLTAEQENYEKYLKAVDWNPMFASKAVKEEGILEKNKTFKALKESYLQGDSYQEPRVGKTACLLENDKKARPYILDREIVKEDKNLQTDQEAVEQEVRRWKVDNMLYEHNQNEYGLNAACGDEEGGRGLKLAFEHEKEEKRWEAAHECVDNENREKVAHMCQGEKQRLKATCVHEQEVKRLKAANEHQEEEKGLEAAHKHEEGEKKLEAGREREEKEKRLKVARECEEEERRLKATREHDEEETRVKTAYDLEEEQKRLKAAHEHDEEEKRLKVAYELEEEDRRLKIACKLDDKNKRFNAARVRVGKEKGPKETHECKEDRQKCAYETEEEKKGLTAVHVNEDKRVEATCMKGPESATVKASHQHEEDEKVKTENQNEVRLKCNHEEEENKSKRFCDACDTEGHDKNPKATKHTCKQGINLKVIEKADTREENGTKLKLFHNGHEEGEEDEKKHATVRLQEENEKLLKMAKTKRCCEVNDKKGRGNEKQKEILDTDHYEKSKMMEVDFRLLEDEDNEERSKEARMDVGCDGNVTMLNAVLRILQVEEIENKQTMSCEKVENLEEGNSIPLQPGVGRKIKGIHDAHWQAYNEEKPNTSQAAIKQEKNGEKLKAVKEGNGFMKDENSINKCMAPLDNKKGSNQLTAAREIIKETENRRKETIQFDHAINNEEKIVRTPQLPQDTEREKKSMDNTYDREERGKEERLSRERELEKERLRKLEEEREREQEREKDRLAIERATHEASERVATEARERSERAAVERALADACKKAEKASSEAARLKADSAAVERATAEAREREAEKAAERDRTDNALRQNPVSDLQDFCGTYGEPALRSKARLERHQRTVERVAKALAEKNLQDILVQREQAARNRLAQNLDADIRRWAIGKEGNLRALLSTLQYILGPESGWQPIPLTEVITAVGVKKAYRRATLCVHPDKVLQRGANIQQKYICEKVFDLLKEAWNRFNSEER